MPLVCFFRPTVLSAMLALGVTNSLALAAPPASPPGSAPVPPLHVRYFLTPDGRLDLERARRSGYEGTLDATGLQPVWDREHDQPVFLPLDTPPNQIDNVNWDRGFHRSGIDGPIFSFLEFDGNLIAGGAMTQAGRALSRYIAAWDGEEWSPLGRGMDFWVVCLAEFRGSLIAGGNFTQADGLPASYIARWNGESWEPLGEGTNGPVWALAVHDDRLVAGGLFTEAGGAPASNLAAWDGTAWAEFHGGTDADVFALLEHSGRLYAAGDFTRAGGTETPHVACWDGGAWISLGPGLPGRANTFAVFRDEIVVGGAFQANAVVPGTWVAIWNGASWRSIGDDLNYGVTQLTVQGDRLIAVGPFRRIGSSPAPGAAAWDGAAWHPLGNRLDDSGTAVAVYRDELIVSGFFDFAGNSLEEGVSLDFLARLEGDRWQPVLDARGRGMNGPVFTLALFEGDLIAGGRFTMAGNTPAHRAARWDGRAWEQLGQGFTHDVNELKVVDGTLYAGGAFLGTIDGTELNGIARWEGGSGWQPIGQGFNRSVFDIEGYYGLLIAAGNMSLTGGRPVNRVCFWDGITWRSLGSGMNGTVLDIHAHGEDLYAAGSFSVNDRGIRYLARWAGTDWEAVPNAFGAPASALASLGNSLVVGGLFNARTTGGTLRHIARWSGAEWLPMGDGFDAPVNTLFKIDGRLVAGGQFLKSGAAPVHSLAQWDGATWLPFGTGVSGSAFIPEVIAMVDRGDRMMVGGYFSRAGQRVSNYIAEWSPYSPGVLRALRAERRDSGAVVDWEVEGAVEDSPEFDVYREAFGQPREKLTAHRLWGDTSYMFRDPDPPRDATEYWLAEVDREGEVTWHGPAAIPSIRVASLALARNVPNPFVNRTTLAYQVPADGTVSLIVYDVRGAEVARIFEGWRTEGDYEAGWDGRDHRGEDAGPGVYFVRLRTPEGTRVQKLVKQALAP